MVLGLSVSTLAYLFICFPTPLQTLAGPQLLVRKAKLAGQIVSSRVASQNVVSNRADILLPGAQRNQQLAKRLLHPLQTVKASTTGCQCSLKYFKNG